MDKVITEVASLFPDSLFHGGGDEPIYKCWNQDQGVVDYMKENNVTGVDLLNKFLQKELDFITRSNKTPILWEGNTLKAFSFVYNTNWLLCRFCYQ